jgi:hypothetical protein
MTDGEVFTFSAARIHVDFQSFRRRLPCQLTSSSSMALSSCRSFAGIIVSNAHAIIYAKPSPIAFQENNNEPRMLADLHGW